MSLPAPTTEHPASSGGVFPAVSIAEIEQALAGAANTEGLGRVPRYSFNQQELDDMMATQRAMERHAVLNLADPDREVWMQTRHGRKFYPLNPRSEEVYIDDIAAALSKLCRYGGHCKWFYSVAEHSVLVSYCVPAEHALAALLHDAPEGYIVDMPRPIKHRLRGYAEIEDRIWHAIAPRFGLPVDLPACVKEADNNVLLAEREQIMEVTGEQWSVPGKPANVQVQCLAPPAAEAVFLGRFAQLTATKP